MDFIVNYFRPLFSTPISAIAQIIGFMAMASAITCFVQKNRKRIMIWQIITCVLWTTHFLTLLISGSSGALIGFAINFMQIIRSLIFINKDERKWTQWNGWPIVFCIITIILGIFSWGSYISILPIIGTCFSNISLWMKKPLTIRCLTIPVSLTWGIYDVFTGSVAGVCNEIFIVISILITIFTFDLKHKNDNTNTSPAENTK